LAEVFPRYGTYAWFQLPGPPDVAGGDGDAGSSLAESRAAGSPVDYPSPVCSSVGDAIDRITAAIDQLASDAQGGASEPELAARVAGVWQMISQLDPELARRTQGYAEQPGGALPE
jgi:hypothetical protein